MSGAQHKQSRRDGDEAAVMYLVDSGEAGEAVRKRGWR
jgi:hypothetical protein